MGLPFPKRLRLTGKISVNISQRHWETEGFYIVEDQSGRKNVRTVDTWGAVRVDDKFIGSNLLGRLLMELRDNHLLEYNLPKDVFDFIEEIRNR